MNKADQDRLIQAGYGAFLSPSLREFVKIINGSPDIFNGSLDSDPQFGKIVVDSSVRLLVFNYLQQFQPHLHAKSILEARAEAVFNRYNGNEFGIHLRDMNLRLSAKLVSLSDKLVSESVLVYPGSEFDDGQLRFNYMFGFWDDAYTFEETRSTLHQEGTTDFWSLGKIRVDAMGTMVPVDIVRPDCPISVGQDGKLLAVVNGVVYTPGALDVSVSNDARLPINPAEVFFMN